MSRFRSRHRVFPPLQKVPTPLFQSVLSSHPRGNSSPVIYYHRSVQPVLELDLNGIISYVLFCTKLLSLSRILRFSQVVCVRSSVLSLQESLPSCGSMTICLSSRGQVSELFPVLAFTNKAAMNILKQVFCGHKHSFLLGICLRVDC